MSIATLTVEVLPLGSDELLGGGFAHGLGEALSRDGVLGGEDAVVYGLAARHVADSGGGEGSKLRAGRLFPPTSGVVGGSAIRALLGLPPLSVERQVDGSLFPGEDGDVNQG